MRNNKLDVFVQKSYDNYEIHQYCSYSIEIKEEKSQNEIKRLLDNPEIITSTEDFLERFSSIDGMNSKIRDIRDFFDTENDNPEIIKSTEDFLERLSSIDGMSSKIRDIRDFFDIEKSSTLLKSSSPSNKPSLSLTLLATLPLVVQNMVGGYLERF